MGYVLYHYDTPDIDQIFQAIDRWVCCTNIEKTKQQICLDLLALKPLRVDTHHKANRIDVTRYDIERDGIFVMLKMYVLDTLLHGITWNQNDRSKKLQYVLDLLHLHDNNRFPLFTVQPGYITSSGDTQEYVLTSMNDYNDVLPALKYINNEHPIIHVISIILTENIYCPCNIHSVGITEQNKLYIVAGRQNPTERTEHIYDGVLRDSCYGGMGNDGMVNNRQ